MEVTPASEINDIRNPGDFTGITFSKYKKTEVRTAFIDCMKKGKIEPSCNWCAELICAGHFMDVWEIILHYMAKHIHLGNPKLVIYLEKRYSVFRNIINQGHFSSEMQLRNNSTIRKLFAEVVCLLALSPRKHSFEPIKINRVEEFDITQMPERLTAPSVHYVEPIFLKDDPKELYIAINEFAYNISKDGQQIMKACYWIEWTIEFENVCVKRKQKCKCELRSRYDVENKYKKDTIWLIWDTLLYYCKQNGDPFIETVMNSLLNLFCIKYTTAAAKRRRYLLYFAVGLLTDVVPKNIDIISDKTTLQAVVSQIDQVYKQIKKKEEAPKTEYLFNGINKNNTFENSIRRMELLNSVDINSKTGTA
jgi:hypothetical protein